MVGAREGSNEVIIGTREGAVRAWAVGRRAEEDRWDGVVDADQVDPAKARPKRGGY